MTFFNTMITDLETIVKALGIGLAIWGIVNLMEGYGNDNPGAKSQGIKQVVAGAGIAFVAIKMLPLLSNLFK